MGSMRTRGVSTAADLEQSLTYVSRGMVPKLPVECSPSEYIAWEQRFEFFITDQDLRHTISPDAPEIAVTSYTNNAYLFGQFGEELVVNTDRYGDTFLTQLLMLRLRLVCTSVTPSRMPRG